MNILNSSIQESTNIIYLKHWKAYKIFCKKHIKGSKKLPFDDRSVAFFIAHLHPKHLQVGTIRSYLSAISFQHKLHCQLDPTTSFIVQKALKGVAKMGSIKKCSLLPITKTKLYAFLQAIPFNSENVYQIKIFRTIFLLAFHACLRAGEVVVSNKKSHTLQLNQVHRNTTCHNDNYIITFRS